MKDTKIINRVASGLVAGLAGTAVIQLLQYAGQKWAPEKMPPLKQHPGEYMVGKVEQLLSAETREKIPQALEKTAAQALGVGYGLTFGVLYELLHCKKSNLLLEGTALGLTAWAAGYLGWLPATCLMPAITRQSPVQVAGAILSHLAYGLSTVGASRVIRESNMVGMAR